MSSPSPSPIDHSEAVAMFRLQVIGTLNGCVFDHGELRAELRRLAEKRWRAPGRSSSHTLSVATIERWYYAFRKNGIRALYPKRRGDFGRGRRLTEVQRKLLLAIRREYPNISAPTVIDSLVRVGQIEGGQLSPSTLNRLYAQHGLRRRARKAPKGAARERRRWQAEAPGVLWHGDVCHGPTLIDDQGRRRPVRIHAMLDDASRYVVALEVHAQEREVDMLGLFSRAILRLGTPSKLYLDNGSTYRGDALATICSRLSVSLLHARPYDPQARGKMERFWRTLREQSLDFIGVEASHHDVEVRLNAWLDQRYHRSAHAGLMGRSPAVAWDDERRVCRRPTDDEMREAWTVHTRRRPRGDGTLDIGEKTYDLSAHFVGAKTVEVLSCYPPLDVDHPPRLLIGDRQVTLVPVDPVRNGRRKRAELPVEKAVQPTGINPADIILDEAAGRIRTSTHTEKK